MEEQVEEGDWQALLRVETPANPKCEFSKYCLATNLMCLEAGNKSLRLNIALSPDLGGDCNGLLEGDQGLARSREFGCSFRIRPENYYD